MKHAKEITEALAEVPNDIAIPVLSDISKRIADWLACGGRQDSDYIQCQVEYAKAIGKKYAQKSPHGNASQIKLSKEILT